MVGLPPKKTIPPVSSTPAPVSSGGTKYGRSWGNLSDLDIELAMFRDTWAPEHFWNIVAIFWPKTSQHPFDRNPWAEQFVENALKHKILSISGAASSGKSDCAAVLAIVCWLSDPRRTLVLITSTSLSESRRRIWGSVVDYWNALPPEIRFVGKLVDSLGIIKINPATKVKASERASIKLIPGEKKKEKEAVGKIIGAKNYRVILICDEMPELSPALLEAALTNLKSNRRFHMWGLGNPSSYYDAHGVFSRPRGGWDTIDLNTFEWATDYGWAIRFDAEKSPNLIHDPTGAEAPWEYLPTKERLDEARAQLGEKSFGFYRQWRGFWFPEGSDTTVFSSTDLIYFRSHRTDVEWESAPTPVAGLDAGYTSGGDRSIAYFGLFGTEAGTGIQIILATEYVLLEDNPMEKELPRNFQIARAYRDECRRRGVEPYHAGIDITGAPTFGDIIAVEFSPDVLRVSMSGKSSKRATGIDRAPANSRFATMGTEIWFSAREMMQSGQLIGLGPEVSGELTSRKYIVLNDVVKLEDKKETKRRTGKSPDIADGLLVMCEVVRQRCKIRLTSKRGPKGGTAPAKSPKAERWNKFRERSRVSFRTGAMRRDAFRPRSKFGAGLSFVR